MAPSSPRTLSRGRLVGFTLLTTAWMLVAVLGALEYGTRLTLDEPFVSGLPMGRAVEATSRFDPDLGWTNKPDVRTEVIAPGFSYRVSINAKGLRDREHEYAKPEGVFRIALLGDSVAWGWGVDDGLTYADLLDAELGPNVEVINFGVPGYGTDQELWTLQQEAVRYDPDLVLLGFILNDVPDNGSGAGVFQDKPFYAKGESGEWVLNNHPVPAPREGTEERALSRSEWMYANSALLQALFPPDSEAQLSDRARAVLDEAAAARPAGSVSEPKVGERGQDELSPRARKLLREEEQMTRALAAEISRPESLTHMLLGRIAAECERMGVPLVAFGVPHHHDRYLYTPDFPAPDWVVNSSPGAEFRTALSLHLAKAGEQLGFETFSVDTAMLAAVREGHVLHCGDGHLNERGNRIVVDRALVELAPYLP